MLWLCGMLSMLFLIIWAGINLALVLTNLDNGKLGTALINIVECIAFSAGAYVCWLGMSTL